MNQYQLLKQMLDFNRAALENAFQGMTVLQEQADRVADACLDQATLVPKEGKAVIEEWRQACRKGRESLKSGLDEGFRQAEAFLAGFPKGE